MTENDGMNIQWSWGWKSPAENACEVRGEERTHAHDEDSLLQMPLNQLLYHVLFGGGFVQQ